MDKALERLERVVNALDDSEYVKTDEFAQVFTALLSVLQKQLSDSNKAIEDGSGSAKAIANQAVAVAQSVEVAFDRLRKELGKRVDEIQLTPGDPGKDADEEAIYQRLLAQIPPAPEPIVETPEETVEKVNKSKVKVSKSQVEGLEDIERIAKISADNTALPPTTPFVNGKRAKNIAFTGSASVSHSGDTATVNITGGGGSGSVESVVAGTGIEVDSSDAANPEVSLDAASQASLALADSSVQGPASSTDNAIARFNGTTGELLQNSGASINDSGYLTATRIGAGIAAPQNPLDVEGGAVVGASYSGTFLAPTNGLLVEGNVGIGLTSGINSKLVVSSTAAYPAGFNGTSTSTTGPYGASLRFKNSSATNGNFAGVAFEDSNNFFVAGVQTKITDHTNHYGEIVLSTRDSGDSDLVERVRINQDGVGIGTTAPGELLDVDGNGNFTGYVTVADEAYGAGWNGSLEVPTKNAIYDKIESLSPGTGTVDTVVAGTGISVDDTDPANPIVSSTITQYTDELAQDAVGGILTDSSEIDFTYDDATPSITASLKAGSIDETKLDASVNASLDLADSAVQDLADLSITASAAELNVLDGITASTTELNYTDGVTSAIQTQIDGKQPLDADLTSWAGVTRASGFDTFAATPSSANLRSLLTDETGTGAAVFATAPTISNPIVSSSVEPGADDTYTGENITGFNATATIAQWESVYLTTTGWALTDADAAATAGGVMLGLASAAGTNGNALTVVTRGIVRNDGWTWSAAGKPLYLSTTAGALTETAPSGTDDVVRVVGYTLSDDCIYFNPSNDWITRV